MTLIYTPNSELTTAQNAFFKETVDYLNSIGIGSHLRVGSTDSKYIPFKKGGSNFCGINFKSPNFVHFFLKTTDTDVIANTSGIEYHTSTTQPLEINFALQDLSYSINPLKKLIPIAWSKFL